MTKIDENQRKTNENQWNTLVFIDFGHFWEAFLAPILSFNRRPRDISPGSARTSSELRVWGLLLVKCQHQAVILNQTRGRYLP